MPAKRNQKKGASTQASRQQSKATSRVASRQDTPDNPGTPSGEAELQDLGTTVIGINFGQTASSIALINKDGRADCIANDDGDRQIATAVSFAGDQTYIGNEAKVQLVRNNSNTILEFRDLIGKKYDEVKSTSALYNSAPITEKDGQPAFSITINDSTTIYTVTEIVTRYLTTLVNYATDFVGRKIHACVMALPDTFSLEQRKVMKTIVEENVGLKVLQFVNEVEATSIAYNFQTSNVVILDVGGSKPTASVVATRKGMLIPLATVKNSECGGDQLDTVLVEFFGKEFTKKSKIQLDKSNHRAMMKLRLAAEVTKRSLSASQSANCSVESLAEGIDFNGSVNRTRFDLLSSKVYSKIVKLVEDAVQQSGLSKESIDEIVLIGGSTKLPAIGERVAAALHSSVKITNRIEPDEVVAVGCVMQAQSIVEDHPLHSVEDLKKFDDSVTATQALETTCLSKPLGLVVPAPKDSPRAVDGKVFMVLVDAMSPLPFKTVFELPVAQGTAGKAVVDLWQGEHDVKVDVPPKSNGAAKARGDDDDDDNDDDDEDEEVRTAIVRPVGVIAHVEVKDAQPRKPITLSVSVDEAGRGRVSAGGVSAEFAV